MLADRLRKAWDERRKSTALDVVMRFSEEGLVFGAGTILCAHNDTGRGVSIDLDEPRLLALLSAAHRRKPPAATRLALIGALTLGLAAISGGEVGAQPPAALEAWMAKPQVNLSKLGVTYWRVVEPWAEPDTVVTIDDASITYSTACDEAWFPYEQDRDWGGLLEVSGGGETERCGRLRSDAFLRFYYFLHEADSAKNSGPFVAIGSSIVAEPYIRLRRFEPTGLEFRRWIISEYLDGSRLTAPDLNYLDHEQQPATTRPPTITFDRGDLEGTPSCGALVGGYALNGHSLNKMHAGFSLHGWCPQNLLDQNQRVLAALRRATQFERRGAQMLLRGAKGEVEVVLSPA